MKAREALEQALAVLRRDELAAWVQIEDALAGLVVECAIGEEWFHVHAGSGLRVLPAQPEEADASARTARRTILELIDGEVSLLEAIRSGRLDMLASTPVLLRLAQAQRAFAEGAARARDVQPVLEQYRAAASELP